MSTDEYTPTTDEVRRAWTDWHDLTGANSRAAFDRWLAEHDRQVAEQAAREIAAGFDDAGAASWIGQRIRNAADAYARADSAAPARTTTGGGEG